MDIKTRFGTAKDIKIDPYGNGTYTLAYIFPMNEYDEYILFGFDAPLEDDPVWRFWVEFGDKDGAADTEDAKISDEDKEKIKKLFEEYKKGE